MYKNRKYRGKTDVAQASNQPRPSQHKEPTMLPPILRETQNTSPILPVAKKQKPNEPDNYCVIPASQSCEVPVRRFLSQRSFMLSQRQTSQTQSIALDQLPKSFYDKILMQCGVDLSNDECFILNTDHFTFASRLRRTLYADSSRIKNFLDGVLQATANGASLAKLMSSGCKICLPDTDEPNQSQESLMMIFLSIDFIQLELLNVLLDKIKTLATDRSSTNVEFFYVELILSHLKYIDHMKHGNILCQKLLEILAIATVHAKQEIIHCLEDLIDPLRHNDFIEKLIELFDDDKELLTQTTVDSFSNMCISIDNQLLVSKKIISYMKQGAPKTLYPSFTKFLLIVSSDDPSALAHIIEELRYCLTWELCPKQPQKDIENIQKIVFDCISRALITSKKLFDIWLKSIQTFNEPKPIDLLILLMMMTINDEKTKSLENIVRRKIKNEQYNAKLVQGIADHFPVIIGEYLVALMELLDNFFRDKNSLISLFSTESYKIVFSIDGCDKRLLLTKIVNFICDQHRSTTTVTDKTMDLTTQALVLLTEVVQKHASKINLNVNNSLKLLRIFEAAELTLTQFRMAMNILCTLAYPVGESVGLESLQDDIDLVMKKQVASSVLTVQNRGIVGIIQIIDRIIWTQNEHCRKMSAEYMDYIFALTCSSSKSMALCYDELAFIISHRNQHKDGRIDFNEEFLNWLLNVIQDDFQKNFVVDQLPDTMDNGTIALEYKYCLNSENDYDCSGDVLHIGIDIANLVLKPSTIAQSSIVVLSSIFNLLRILIFRKNQNLQEINAVLGCAIVLPKCMSDCPATDIFDEYTEEQIRQLLDIYFYTVNWMREVISAFVSDPDVQLKKKVLTRLTQVIKLEETIRILLHKSPIDYLPPNCTQRNQIKFKKPLANKGRKKVSNAAATGSTTNAETENISMLIATGAEPLNLAPTNAAGRLNLYSYGPKEVYRQMDPDIMLLLNETLEICYRLPDDKIGLALGLQEFKFIIEDLVLKMESAFGKGHWNDDQTRQHLLYPCDFLNDFIEFLPKIMTIFIQLTDHMKNVLNKPEITPDHADLFTDDINCTKLCIDLCLRLFVVLFGWPEFDKEPQRNLLTSMEIQGSFYCFSGTGFSRTCLNSCLNIFAIDTEIEETAVADRTIAQLIKGAIIRFESFENVILNLKSAVQMYHLIMELSRFSTESMTSHSVNLCRTFLSRKWYSLEGSRDSGAQYNCYLDTLLKGLFVDATVADIRKYLNWTIDECSDLSKKNGILTTFPCFNKLNFPLFYRALCSALVQSTTMEIEKSGPTSGHLRIWEKACDRLENLLTIAKTLESPRNLSLFLKHAHIFLKLFLQHGIPMLETALKLHYQRICQLLTTLQRSTRYMHKLCCHSKAIENKAIIGQIPFIRETLEAFVFKVKAALAANKCSAAFWMGTLTNKDIHDKPVMEKQCRSENDSTNDEEHMPPEDDSLDDVEEIESTTVQDTSSDVTNNSSSMHQPSTSRMSRSRVF